MKVDMNELICNVQKYGWGRKGSESRVAVFKKSQSPEFEIDEAARYAELWMGTHPNCPSEIQLGEGRVLLSEYLKRQGGRALGEKCLKEFFEASRGQTPLQPGELPFLFKVLSINQALSIQAHPNKPHAQELHARDPKNYPDSNHKPEMLIAIRDGFEALCGFRPAGEIARHFEQYPELAQLCHPYVTDFIRSLASDGDNLESILKKCFQSLMSSGDDQIRACLDRLKTRISTDKEGSELDSLFIRLSEEYPGDVGCFSIYLLNYLKLRKGEAIFLAANIPHAYLFGDGVECMACSDNVVRAGLTPKFKDVQVLCSMLDYRMRSAEENKLKPEPRSPHLTEFRPSVNEFSVQQIRVQSNETAQCIIPVMDTASILIVVENSFINSSFQVDSRKLDARSGLVYFIDAHTGATFNGSASNLGSELLAFRAYIDVKS